MGTERIGRDEAGCTNQRLFGKRNEWVFGVNAHHTYIRMLHTPLQGVLHRY